MGCRPSCLAGPPSHGPPHPVTGLTNRDVYFIRQSWRELTKKNLLIPTGAELFVTLFEEYPYMMSFFERFGLAETPARINRRLSAHALTFMNGFALYVDYIDAPDAIMGLLQRVALNHLHRTITIAEMERMAGLFVRTLKSQLGRHFTDEMAYAWAAFFDFINNVYEHVEVKVQGIVEQRSKFTGATTPTITVSSHAF